LLCGISSSRLIKNESKFKNSPDEPVSLGVHNEKETTLPLRPSSSS
jgi:hypothetical protein